MNRSVGVLKLTIGNKKKKKTAHFWGTLFVRICIVWLNKIEKKFEPPKTTLFTASLNIFAGRKLLQK
jgi:hypothetical protein